MTKYNVFRKTLVIAIIFCFVGAGVVPNILVRNVRADPGDVIYVPDDYPTIQSAIDNANSGDTILVNPGIYYENLNINKPFLTVKSSSGNPKDTIIKSSLTL